MTTLFEMPKLGGESEVGFVALPYSFYSQCKLFKESALAPLPFRVNKISHFISFLQLLKEFQKNNPDVEVQKGRDRVNCPVGGCKASIVNLKRHLVNVHKWEGEKARTARLNFGLRKDFKAKHISRRKTVNGGVSKSANHDTNFRFSSYRKFGKVTTER